MFKLKKTILDNEIKSEKNSLNAKTVLIWGSQNSGKTVLATLLAKKLSKQNKDKNVALVYTEENLPIIPCLFPTKKLDNIESLGSLYTPTKITKNYLLENLTTLKEIDNLGILGFQKGENFAMYPNLNDVLANEIISELKNCFDYVIIDGTTFFSSNQFTVSSINNVDVTLRVCSTDLKSMSYFLSQEMFLKKVGIEFNNEKVIINKIFEDNSIDREFISNNHFDYKISYSANIEENLKQGNILLNIEDDNFNKDIEKILEEIF